MTSKLTLGYWGIRGRGQVTRLVCAYTGIEWEEKTYTNPEEWFGKDKQELGILFPNLPYIIDGDLKISESDVLPRYVIKKSGKTELLGKDPKDMALVDNVIYVVLDLWNPISQLFFNKKWQDEKTGVFYQLKSKFAKL
jgi:glutathione S-transferase